jgi:hypothetical protein
MDSPRVLRKGSPTELELRTDSVPELRTDSLQELRRGLQRLPQLCTDTEPDRTLVPELRTDFHRMG